VALILTAYGPHIGMTVDAEATRDLTAAFRIELRGLVSFVVRFDHGRYSVEPDGSVPTDCTLSADPAAFLLVTSERMVRWPALALGLYEVGGQRPELAVGFKDLFVFP
jgi:SCP-2 sterol transfer family protein